MATKDFVDFTPSSGSGNGTVNVETGPNYSMEDKSVNLSVVGTGGSPSKAVNVTQEGIPFMILKSLLPCFKTINNENPYSINIYSDSSGIFTFEVDVQVFLNMLDSSNDIIFFLNIYVPNVSTLILRLDNGVQSKDFTLLKNNNIFYIDGTLQRELIAGDVPPLGQEGSTYYFYKIMSGNKIICQYKLI